MSKINIETVPKGTNTLDVTRLMEIQRVTEEVVENLDDYSLDFLLSGNESDVDVFLRILKEETGKALYGNKEIVSEGGIEYVSHLQETFEETLRIESFAYFLTSVFVDFDLNWHHIEWANMAQLYKKLCIIAARDHGKSYFWSNAYLIWKMYRYQNPRKVLNKPRRELSLLSERGVLITNEMSLGRELLEMLKDNIESNDVLRERLYPDTKENWSKESIKCKNGARLQVKSYGTKFRGRHPAYAVVDDYLDDSALYSKDQREKFSNYFHSVIMNAVLKDGDVKVIGTPFHEKDLYGGLKTKKNWKLFEYPSIMPTGEVLWPQRYDLNDLLEKREDQGSIIFTREHLVKPVASNSTLFTHDLVLSATSGMDQYKLVKSRENFGKIFPLVVTGCDFAMSANVGADYTVFLTWGVEINGTMWLLHMWRVKGRKYGEQLAMLKAINRNFKPDVFMLETNQFQQIFADGAEEIGLPIFPHNTGRDKHDLRKGLPSVVVRFERGKIKLPRGDQHSINQTDIIISELTSVAWTDKGLQGVGEHDDCPMAVWQSDLAARFILQGDFKLGFL